jgi:hypothetical protein
MYEITRWRGGVALLFQMQMGRKLEFPERIITPLAVGTTAAIDAIRGDQPRVAFIREAIERELRRRDARAKKTSKKKSNG